MIQWLAQALEKQGFNSDTGYLYALNYTKNENGLESATYLHITYGEQYHEIGMPHFNNKYVAEK